MAAMWWKAGAEASSFGAILFTLPLQLFQRITVAYDVDSNAAAAKNSLLEAGSIAASCRHICPFQESRLRMADQGGYAWVPVDY